MTDTADTVGVRFEGSLKKKTSGLVSYWHDRHFVLTQASAKHPASLLYFDGAKDYQHLIGVLPVEWIERVTVSDTKDKKEAGKRWQIITQNQEQRETQSKTFDLLADSSDECRKWMESLEQAIKENSTDQPRRKSTTTKKKYWKDGNLKQDWSSVHYINASQLPTAYSAPVVSAPAMVAVLTHSSSEPALLVDPAILAAESSAAPSGSHHRRVSHDYQPMSENEQHEEPLAVMPTPPPADDLHMEVIMHEDMAVEIVEPAQEEKLDDEVSERDDKINNQPLADSAVSEQAVGASHIVAPVNDTPAVTSETNEQADASIHTDLVDASDEIRPREPKKRTGGSCWCLRADD